MAVYGGLTDIATNWRSWPPIAAATSIYWLFRALDRRASIPARTAISSWLLKVPPNEHEIQSAIVGAFDNLYATPLLSYSAFLRSSIISFVAFVLWQFYVWSHGLRESDLSLYIVFLAGNILTDYVSLFFVRLSLTSIANSRLILLNAPVIGWIVVCFVFAFCKMLWMLILLETNAVEFGGVLEVSK